MLLSNNFVVAVLDCIFKTGKSGTQRYLDIPGMLNVLWFTWLLATSHSILSWVIWLSRSSMMCLKRSRSVSQPSPAEQRMDSSRSFMRCWTSSFSLIHSSFFVLYVVLEISGHWSICPKIKMSPTFLYWLWHQIIFHIFVCSNQNLTPWYFYFITVLGW